MKPTNQSVGKGHPRLLAMFAHPDDESFGPGGTIAKYASEGVEVRLIVATRGEKSTMGSSEKYGADELGAIRERELCSAAEVLGVRQVRVLGYLDTRLHEADPEELASALGRAMIEIRPDVVITFDPGGITANPDHVAVTKAVSQAFSDIYPRQQGQDLLQSRLYYWVVPQTIATHLREVSNIDFVGTPEDSITTIIDVSASLGRQWQAIRCHKSQSDPIPAVLKERLQAQGGREFFVRAGRVPQASGVETDLFG
ncbi:MAG: PIG-L deacetylase family protein [Dehalococcoidia bacterium]